MKTQRQEQAEDKCKDRKNKENKGSKYGIKDIHYK
jgi:hypothetical protein